MAAELREAPKPRWTTREEMEQDIEKSHGQEVLQILKGSVNNKQDAVEDLLKTSPNGQGEKLRKLSVEYLKHEQEFARAEQLNEKWYQKGWRYTKEGVKKTAEVVTTPFRWTWQTMKKYPKTTALVVGGLVLGGAVLALYLTGNFDIVKRAAEWAKGIAQQGFEKGKELAGNALEKGKELGGKLKDGMKTMPPADVPGSIPAPKPAPPLSPEDADRLLRG